MFRVGQVAGISAILVVMAASGLGVGCYKSAPPPVSVGVMEQMPPDDQVGVDDIFDVRVFGENDLSSTYRVASDGTIDFPLAGRIQVAGLRTGDIQKKVTERLREGYLKNPQVTVVMKEWNSRKVSVLGQVQKPGPVAYHPHMTIIDAIALAGGFTGIAAKNSVSLRREGGGKVESRVYRVADITEGRSSNIPVLPGDLVVVEERLF
ncbi:MAG: polysaccharide biosynthesis/export family protein [Polyangia bacterium]